MIASEASFCPLDDEFLNCLLDNKGGKLGTSSMFDFGNFWWFSE